MKRTAAVRSRTTPVLVVTLTGIALCSSGRLTVTSAGTDGSVMMQAGPCLATTGSGDVQGLLRGGTCTYLGVPYAAPPTGNLRWRPPQPRAPWAPATLPVTTAAAACAQLNLAGAPTGSEDCLTLNIWTPAVKREGRGVPVIVWLHTGGFQGASSNFAASDGRRFAEERGAIVVAPNYRLGPFGLLAHSALTAEDASYPSSGNYTLADQRVALGWVRANIDAFGGDPNNVTLAGTSAGAQSTGLHLVSPASRGLFQRAIVQSGPVTLRWKTASEAEAHGETFAAALGCTDRASVLACLRSKTPVQVLQAQPVGSAQVVDELTQMQWAPIVDGLEIPDQPRELFRRGQFRPIPVIVGVTADEGWTFVDRSFPRGLDALQYERAVAAEFGIDADAILNLYPVTAFSTPKDALVRLTGDVEYVCEGRRLARFFYDNGAPAYLYSFHYTVDTITPGRSFHGIESNFLFGNNFAAPSIHVLTGDDVRLFGAMSSYWREFAETGEPNAPGVPVRWPLYQPESAGQSALSERYLILDRSIQEASHLRDHQCNFWERFNFRTVLGVVPAAAR